jgi:hypothetical protein
MATTTAETNSRVQAAADETTRSGIKAFDALTDYYLAAFDAGLKLQGRAIETTKLMLDESVALQRANRKLAEELFSSFRKTEDLLTDSLDQNLKAWQNPWTGVPRR